MRGRGEPSDAFSEREYVFGACAGAALVAIRDATNKGWALGTDRFMERIAAAVSRRVAPLPKGRPRKGRN
jgi:putative transposase